MTLKKSESAKENMFTPDFSNGSRKLNGKITSPIVKDMELKRVLLGKENVSSN